MSKRRAWLTGETPPPEEIRGRCFAVPNDLALVSAVTGALLPLTLPENWEQSGSMTVSEAAEIMSVAFEDFVSGECGSGDCPPVEIPGLSAPIYRYNSVSTRWEKLEDGEWVEPTGDEEIPPPEPREELTEAEQECGAASNAANVLRELYTNILTVYDEQVDPLLNQAEIAAQVAVAIGSKFGPISATFLSLSGIAWEMFTLALQEITEDDWTEEFHEILVCILNSASEVLEDGTVHFNLYQVCSDLVGFILPVVDSHVRVRWQTWYLLQMIGSQGLDTAGGTTAVEGDCVTCDEWCFKWDQSNGLLTNGDWTISEGSADLSGYIKWVSYGTPYDGAYRRIRLQKTIDTSRCVITSVALRWSSPAGGTSKYFYSTVSNSVGLNVNAAASIYDTGLAYSFSTGYDLGDETTGVESAFDIRLTSNHNGDWRLLGIKLTGTGENPFGVGSNC